MKKRLLKKHQRNWRKRRRLNFIELLLNLSQKRRKVKKKENTCFLIDSLNSSEPKILHLTQS
jgi:predicted RNA-binding protein Jag